MAGLVSITLNIILAFANLSLVAPSIGDSQYGKLLYEVRAVTRSRGIGGSPAYCVGVSRDLILIVYTVRNDNEYAMSAQAVPRLVMLDPAGVTVRHDQALTDAMIGKLPPYLVIRGGRLEPGQQVVLADVFTTARNSTRDLVWQFRIDPLTTRPVLLPQPQQTQIAGCV